MRKYGYSHYDTGDANGGQIPPPGRRRPPVHRSPVTNRGSDTSSWWKAGASSTLPAFRYSLWRAQDVCGSAMLVTGREVIAVFP